MTLLAKCTWPEAHDLFDENLVAILPIGSTEPHGPHLPLDTDVTIAEAQSRRAVEIMSAAGVKAVLLPTIPFGLTHFTEGFAGRITVQPGTLWTMLEDVVSSLGEQGVRKVVFSNGHLEPEHVAILRGVCADHAEARKGKAQVVFPDNTRRRWAETLGDEFKSGDCHAGRYESSIVLAADEEAVRESERTALAPLEIGLIERMNEGAKTFQQAGAENAYCGDPAAATSAEGAELIESLATMIVTTVKETWPELFQ